MSLVSNVLLHIGTLEEVTLEQINAGLPQSAAREDLHEELRPLSWDEEPDRLWGGYKNPETRLFGCAFNYLRQDEFLAHLAELPWTDPHAVQVFIQGQHDERFTVYELNAGAWSTLVDRNAGRLI